VKILPRHTPGVVRPWEWTPLLQHRVVEDEQPMATPPPSPGTRMPPPQPTHLIANYCWSISLGGRSEPDTHTGASHIIQATT
jgi:hypothetical protein